MAGHIKSDLVADPKVDARLFNWANLVPNDAEQFNTSALYSDRDTIIDWGLQFRNENQDKLLQWVMKYAADKSLANSPSAALRLTESQIPSIVSDSQTAVAAWQELRGIAEPGFEKMKQNAVNNGPLSTKLAQLKNRFSYGVLALRPADFEDEPFGWGEIDLFQQSFSRLFLGYFEQKRLNLLRRMDEDAGQNPGVPSISDAEFLTHHGEPPWEFVNRTLRNAGLDFQIDYPVQHSTTRFTPQLTKTSSGADLRFSDLSSGEKILMSFAFCLYYSLDKRQIVKRPKLLLFDEVDAPLHPSMSRQLIDTIQKALVQEQGVKVILTTHSPSTVAVTPEECVYAMRRDQSGVHKVGKRQAIAILTAEIPTLSIDFAGRRQVFVESHLDAERYEKLYRFLSPRIASERSLAFIGVGKKSESGDVGSGCDQVRRIVKELTSNGNESVFGLIDWDQKNCLGDHIIVLAEGKRYAIENCLLDPLLVGALAVRTERSLGNTIGLPQNKGYPDFRSLTPTECQIVVDGVERVVFGLPPAGEFGSRDEVEYAGGMKLRVSHEFLLKQGHELETLLKERLPQLRRYHNEGDLLMALIDPIIVDLPEFAPKELVDAFETILSY
jgi:hypothetical protein